MPSPFPGMNPYLEHPLVWKDFHDTYIPALREAINRQVIPAGYYTRIEQYLFIRDAWREEEDPAGQGDLAVERRNGHGRPTAPGTTTAVVNAPVAGLLPDTIDIERMPYLEVINRASREVVTVIEVLSPANKMPGKDRAKYLGKRQELLRGDVNLVEIDLLRGWKRMPVENLPACDYCVMVSWAETRPAVGLWPIGLRDPLPPIPIPLRPGSPEPTVDIQAVLHRVYDGADYEIDIYHHEAEPALSADDAAWARDRLAAAGVTPAG